MAEFSDTLYLDYFFLYVVLFIEYQDILLQNKEKEMARAIKRIREKKVEYIKAANHFRVVTNVL